MSGILDKYDEAINLTYNYTYRMLIHLKNIQGNYENLHEADEITLEVYRDSIIKKYETLEDLTWKLLSKIFKADGLEINSPRGCYKHAFKEGLIDDMIIWNDILLARNSTAHVYDEDDYEEIKNAILDRYVKAIENLLDKISTEKL
ncbi:MAG: HI0074 family nucleotidyltransferase substrate-binding subunit [Sarcina sp.]